MIIRLRQGYSKKLIIISTATIIIISLIILIASQNLLPPTDEEEIIQWGGIEWKSEPSDHNITRYSLDDSFNLDKILRLEVSYRILEDRELYQKALAYLNKIGVEEAVNLSINDIAIVEVKIVLWNAGDERFYVFGSGYCSGTPPYRAGVVYGWTESETNLYKEFFWEVDSPIAKLGVDVISGTWYAPAILCTLDLRIYNVDPNDRYENTYLFIVSKPFKGVFKAEVRAGPFPSESYFEKVFTEEVVVEINS